MKKFVLILLALIMILSCVACTQNGNKPNDTSKQADTSKASDTSKPDDNKKVNATPAEIESAIAKALGDNYLPTVEVAQDELFLTPLGGLDMDKIESYIVKQAVIPSVDLDTIVIVKCKSGYADEAVKGINDAFAQSVSYIRQYPFGVAKVEGARLYKIDNTVIYVIAGASAGENTSDEDAARLADSEYTKIDAAIKGIFGKLPENLAVIPADDGNGGGGLIGG